MSRKGAVLRHVLLLNINRTAYMVIPMVCLHFTSVTLKDQCQDHSDLEGLYLMKEPR